MTLGQLSVAPRQDTIMLRLLLTLLTLLALLGLEEVRGAPRPRPQAEDTEATGRNIRVTQHVQVQQQAASDMENISTFL